MITIKSLILIVENSVRCVFKVPQCSTSIKNEKVYEYIRMDNIELERDLLGEKFKNKSINAYTNIRYKNMIDGKNTFPT